MKHLTYLVILDFTFKTCICVCYKKKISDNNNKKNKSYHNKINSDNNSASKPGNICNLNSNVPDSINLDYSYVNLQYNITNKKDDKNKKEPSLW